MKAPMTLVFCAAALLLSACGGGDDSPEPTPTPEPTASVPSDARRSGWPPAASVPTQVLSC